MILAATKPLFHTKIALSQLIAWALYQGVCVMRESAVIWTFWTGLLLLPTGVIASREKLDAFVKNKSTLFDLGFELSLLSQMCLD